MQKYDFHITLEAINDMADMSDYVEAQFGVERANEARAEIGAQLKLIHEFPFAWADFETMIAHLFATVHPGCLRPHRRLSHKEGEPHSVRWYDEHTILSKGAFFEAVGESSRVYVKRFVEDT